MASIPTLFNGRADFKEISTLSRYEKTEHIYIYDLDSFGTEIKGKYILDYDSSVWIRNSIKYEKFAQLFAVRSGGWYGPDKGGRWNTIKRTFGEIFFIEVENFHTITSPTIDHDTLRIIKNRFSNKLTVEIKSRDKLTYNFDCNKIKFFPSLRILLLERKTEKYIDKTEILDSNGLSLLEEVFI